MEEKFWEKVLEKIQSKAKDKSWEIWTHPIKVIEIRENNVLFEVPNQMFSNWLLSNYKREIEDTALEMFDKELKIEFQYKIDTVKKSEEVIPPEEESIESASSRLQLNSKYTFDTFVKGPSNRFAYEVSQAIAQEPGKKYNPVFIYGGVGLGKTHLLHAIAHYLFKHHRNKKIIYITSEQFVSEMIDAIKMDRVTSFRNKFRDIDCLLIDDIQFLVNKQRSQEEFFYAFNTLYDSRKQLVITSDRAPKELPTIEERLISRFEWGVVADIKAPDYETRIAILKKKSELENIDIPDDVIAYLASIIEDNIRVLEGSLIRIAAFSLLNDTPLTVDISKQILSDIIQRKEQERLITVEKIQTAVADHFQISVNDLKSKKRIEKIALPRQIAMYLTRILTELSTPEIGAAFGGKEHPTVLHACRKIKSKMENDPQLSNEVNKLIQKIKGA